MGNTDKRGVMEWAALYVKGVSVVKDGEQDLYYWDGLLIGGVDLTTGDYVFNKNKSTERLIRMRKAFYV